ncbi:MAG TPA: isopentenyl-diphosphate Delta-isomerase [Woeseiaceae bacterium]|nr:isopentenyl-diphosphate Delta-isomerase [Woeseiaceae bacterium]
MSRADGGNRVVSSDSEQLILVDSDDAEAGFLDKGRCHDGEGILHRAFSLFIFNNRGELLLQQRAAGKRLWPMYWSNSCCSHPRKGEGMPDATRRRLADELGIEASLEFVYKFSYQARFGDKGSENELCSVFLGRSDDPVRPNRTEIAAIRHVEASALTRELQSSPQAFTPWFKMEWDELRTRFAATLAAYTDRKRW